MAEQTTISRPAPYLEAAGQTLLDLTTKLTGQPIDTSKFAPSVAGQNVLTQAAQQQAATQAGLGTLSFDPTTGAVTGAGAGTGIAGYQPFLQQAASLYGTAAGDISAARGMIGPQAYQSFMSPYQQDVIDTTLSQFDIQAQKGMQPLAASQVAAGAFGQGRGQVQAAEYQSQSDLNRALLQAQLQQQGFGQAQQAAAQAQAQQAAIGQQSLGLGSAQAGLASLQPSLAQSQIQQLGAAGTSNLAYEQAIRDAQAQAGQLAAYEPYNRLQFLSATTGGLLAGQPQAYMTQQQGGAGTASPLSSALSGAATVYGLGSLFGGR
jgi:Arc/MetJ-type ribon-helix-helix transcriptional regulator